MQKVANPEEDILTGIQEIDMQLVGGLRAGSLVLIEGPSESGKSVLSQRFAYNALRKNTNAVVYYTTKHDVKGLVAQMDSLAFHILDNLLADSFRIYPLHLPFSPREAFKAIYLLNSHISQLPERFNMVIIDSITPFIAKLSQAYKCGFFNNSKTLCGERHIIILVANSHIFEKETFPRIRLTCDYHMELKLKVLRFQEGRSEERIVCRMRIPKLHGVDLENRESIRFEVKPKEGILVIPYSKMAI